MLKYDPREAQFLLGETGTKLSVQKQIVAQENAAKELLKELCKLDGCGGFSIKQDRIEPVDPVEAVDITIHNRGVTPIRIMYESEGTFCLFRMKGIGNTPAAIPDVDTREEVKLIYNENTKAFEGEEEDTFFSPMAGEPKRRKNGLTVLVAAAIQKWEDQIKP